MLFWHTFSLCSSSEIIVILHSRNICNSRLPFSWKVLDIIVKFSGPWKSWKFKFKVLESPGICWDTDTMMRMQMRNIHVCTALVFVNCDSFIHWETILLKLQHKVHNGLNLWLIAFFKNVTYFSGGFRSSNICGSGQQYTLAATVASGTNLFIGLWLLAIDVVISQSLCCSHGFIYSTAGCVTGQLRNSKSCGRR